MQRTWRHIKPINELHIISDLKKNIHQSQISESVKNFIMSHNAGKINPSPYIWLHGRGFVFYEVLDFSSENKYVYEANYATWDKNGKLSDENYIPFAVTKDREGVFILKNEAVCVYDVEVGDISMISSSFTSFQNEYLSNTVDTND